MTAPGRRCLTVDEAFTAGWADAADAPPLTPSQIDLLVAMHRRYLLLGAVAYAERRAS